MDNSIPRIFVMKGPNNFQLHSSRILPTIEWRLFPGTFLFRACFSSSPFQSIRTTVGGSMFTPNTDVVTGRHLPSSQPVSSQEPEVARSRDVFRSDQSAHVKRHSWPRTVWPACRGFYRAAKLIPAMFPSRTRGKFGKEGLYGNVVPDSSV